MSGPTLRQNRQIGECLVADCDKPAKMKFCAKHYRNLRLHGTFEAPPRGIPPEKRFWSRINKTETCWLWTGYPAAGTGYGHLLVAGKWTAVHRYSYELLVGPIPEGLVIDHLCRVRLCVNPSHLEAVTQRENLRRGTSPGALAVAKNACHRGHPLVGDNVYINPTTRHRYCRTCQRERNAKRDSGRRRVTPSRW